MSKPPGRAPHGRGPRDHGPRDPRGPMPCLCDLRVCEPLVVTLALLIVFLSYRQVVPAPFVPAPRPPASTPVAGARDGALLPPPPSAPTRTALPIHSPPLSTEVMAPPHSTPTQTPANEPTIPVTAAPTQEPTAATALTSAPTQESTTTSTATTALTAAPTQESTTTPTATTALTATPTQEPTAPPTSDAPTWDLAQDIVGLWEHVDPARQYYFDFTEDELVVMAGMGARLYVTEGDRTIVIQRSGDAWMLTVHDLTQDTLALEGVFGEWDEFYRREGVPDLQQALIGLWMDPDADQFPLEFTPNGIALGEFGRGTYFLVSDSHALIHCDDPASCAPFRPYDQPEDAPLALRVYEIVNDRITVRGLGTAEPRTLERVAGYPTLAANVVGLWENQVGSSVEFTDAGDLLLDGAPEGSYEVLSETTLWVTLDGLEEAWVVTDLDANTLAYIKMDLYWDDPSVYSRVD